MLVLCLALVTVMMTLISPSFTNEDKSAEGMVWGLYGVTVCMAGVALRKIVRRCIVSASVMEVVARDEEVGEEEEGKESEGGRGRGGSGYARLDDVDEEEVGPPEVVEV